MRISHEAIYQALYIQGRGALKRELVACLRTGRALRVPRARARQRATGHVTAEVMISERPAEAEDRAVPGHWEGDLIIGLNRSAIGTVVERTTRFTMLVHLPAYGGLRHRTSGQERPRARRIRRCSDARRARVEVHNDARAAAAILDLGSRQGTLPTRTAHHRTGLAIYFADPHSPWQRGTNENTNGLLRQYFPKGTDLSRWSQDEIEAVAAALNSRPRKTLTWRTPAEALNEHLLSLQQAGVATTD